MTEAIEWLLIGIVGSVIIMALLGAMQHAVD